MSALEFEDKISDAFRAKRISSVPRLDLAVLGFGRRSGSSLNPFGLYDPCCHPPGTLGQSPAVLGDRMDYIQKIN